MCDHKFAKNSKTQKKKQKYIVNQKKCQKSKNNQFFCEKIKKMHQNYKKSKLWEIV